MKKDTGARWEITIDGVPRSYRDRKEMAIEGAEYLKSRNPTAEMTVRDYTGKEPPFVIKPQLPPGEAVTRGKYAVLIPSELLRGAASSAQEEIDEPTGKFLRPHQGANTRLLAQRSRAFRSVIAP